MIARRENLVGFDDALSVIVDKLQPEVLCSDPDLVRRLVSTDRTLKLMHILTRRLQRLPNGHPDEAKHLRAIMLLLNTPAPSASSGLDERRALG
jgi:hypothetical protein